MHLQTEVELVQKFAAQVKVHLLLGHGWVDLIEVEGLPNWTDMSNFNHNSAFLPDRIDSFTSCC